MDEAAGLGFASIKEGIEAIALSLKMVQKELNIFIGLSLSSEDKFVEAMSPFAVQCQHEVDELTDTLHRMQNSYIKVGMHFAFDVNKIPMEEYLSHIKLFKSQFGKKYAEIVARKNQKIEKIQPTLPLCEKARKTEDAQQNEEEASFDASMSIIFIESDIKLRSKFRNSISSCRNIEKPAYSGSRQVG